MSRDVVTLEPDGQDRAVSIPPHGGVVGLTGGVVGDRLDERFVRVDLGCPLEIGTKGVELDRGGGRGLDLDRCRAGEQTPAVVSPGDLDHDRIVL